jgi:hypothetical protein
MTLDELYALFEKHGDEYLKFERIIAPLNRRPDLHAFILLDRLVPGRDDMVAAAEHDEIFLDVSLGDLVAVVTEEGIIDLIRCGVRLNYESLAMFA